MPTSSQIKLSQAPQLAIPVSNLEFSAQQESASSPIKRAPGQIDWLPSGVMHPLINNGTKTARFVILEFNAKGPKP